MAVPSFVIVEALYPGMTQLDFTGPHTVLTRIPGAEVIVQDGLAVISKGLASGEPVVTEGQYRLNDGSKIAVGGPQPAPGSAAQAGGGAPATASR